MSKIKDQTKDYNNCLKDLDDESPFIRRMSISTARTIVSMDNHARQFIEMAFVPRLKMLLYDHHRGVRYSTLRLIRGASKAGAANEFIHVGFISELCRIVLSSDRKASALALKALGMIFEKAKIVSQVDEELYQKVMDSMIYHLKDPPSWSYHRAVCYSLERSISRFGPVVEERTDTDDERADTDEETTDNTEGKPDPDEEASGIRNIRRFSDPYEDHIFESGIVGSLLELSNSENVRTRRCILNCINALVDAGYKDRMRELGAMGILLENMHHKDRQVRKIAGEGLRKFTASSDHITPPYIPHLRHCKTPISVTVKRNGIGTISDTTTSDPDMQQMIIQLVSLSHHKKKAIRVSARESIVFMLRESKDKGLVQPEILTVVVDTLTKQYGKLRKHAAETIRYLADRGYSNQLIQANALPPLIELLEGKGAILKFFYTEHAGNALVALGKERMDDVINSGTLQKLKKLTSLHKWKWRHIEAWQIIGKLGENGAGPEIVERGFLKGIKTALGDRNKFRRERHLRVTDRLVKGGEAKALMEAGILSRVVELLDDPWFSNQVKAAHILPSLVKMRQIDHLREIVQPRDLINRLSSENEQLRETIAHFFMTLFSSGNFLDDMNNESVRTIINNLKLLEDYDLKRIDMIIQGYQNLMRAKKNDPESPAILIPAYLDVLDSLVNWEEEYIEYEGDTGMAEELFSIEKNVILALWESINLSPIDDEMSNKILGRISEKLNDLRFWQVERIYLQQENEGELTALMIFILGEMGDHDELETIERFIDNDIQVSLELPDGVRLEGSVHEIAMEAIGKIKKRENPLSQVKGYEKLVANAEK